MYLNRHLDLLAVVSGLEWPAISIGDRDDTISNFMLFEIGGYSFSEFGRGSKEKAIWDVVI